MPSIILGKIRTEVLFFRPNFDAGELFHYRRKARKIRFIQFRKQFTDELCVDPQTFTAQQASLARDRDLDNAPVLQISIPSDKPLDFELVNKTRNRGLGQNGRIGQPSHWRRPLLLEDFQNLELCRADPKAGDVLLPLARYLTPRIRDLPPKFELVSVCSSDSFSL